MDLGQELATFFWAAFHPHDIIAAIELYWQITCRAARRRGHIPLLCDRHTIPVLATQLIRNQLKLKRLANILVCPSFTLAFPFPNAALFKKHPERYEAASATLAAIASYPGWFDQPSRAGCNRAPWNRESRAPRNAQ
jgi:hypothetical protein